MQSPDKNRVDIQSIGLGGSILLLVLHVYHYCFDLFNAAGICGVFGDQLMVVIGRTGLFKHVYTGQLLALAFLSLSVLVTRGRKDGSRSWQYGVKVLGGGLALYFSVDLLLPYLHSRGLLAFPVLEGIGYVLILHGAHSLARLLPGMLTRHDPFGRDQMGFPQDEKKRIGPFSLHFPARYRLQGQERSSWVNVVNPRRGLLVIGTPGCGKSRFVIEPIMRQLMSRGMAVFLYDFKYDALSRQAWALFQEYSHQYPPGARFCCVNFSDLARSDRCNVLAPSTLRYVSDVMGISKTILFSLNKSWVGKQGDFFVDSPIAFLTAVIWWLKEYEQGRYCTLPHVIELCNRPYHQLFSLLRMNPESAQLVNPFIQAYLNGAGDMLEGQLSSVKIPLSKLMSSDIYYVLTGDDFKLTINDPAEPLVFCLGGHPQRAEALAPVLSLFADRVNQLVNEPGRHPVALIYDEFSSIRAYSILLTVATGRSNNVLPILAVQDLSQLRTQYSHEEANAILSICGNLICGQASGETARWVSERFLKIWQDRTTISTNTSDTSFSRSQQWETAVTPAMIAQLSSGEFVGVVADDPDTPLELKGFHARLQREEEDRQLGTMPVVRTINERAVEHAFRMVKADIETISNAEYERMQREETLKRLVLS